MRTVEIFLRYRFLRLKNVFFSSGIFGKKKDGKRTGTPSRFSPNVVFGFIILVWISFSVYGFQWTQIHGFLQGSEAVAPESVYEVSLPLMRLLATYLGLNFLGGLFFSLGSRQFSQTESDLEFLSTLPVPRSLLMFVRVVERAFINPTFYFLLFPCFVILFQREDHSLLTSAILGLLFALPLFLISGAVQAFIDTGLRLKLKPMRIKMLQGILSMLGVFFFYLLNMTRGAGLHYLRSLSESLSSFILMTPPGLLILGFYSKTFPYSEMFYLLIEVLVLAGVSYGLLLFLVRDGVVLNSGQSSVRKVRGSAIHTPARTSVFAPLVWRELLLLKRDPSYLFQTLLIPVLVFGAQIAIFSSFPDKILTGTAAMLSLGFGMAAYSMLFSCFMGLQTEGKSLWIWYTLPDSLENLVWKKSLKWILLANGFFYVFLCAAILTSRLQVGWSDAPALFAAAAGVPLFGWLATSFGILGFDSAGTNPRRVKQGATYAYLLFAATYVILFHLHDTWQTLLGVGLMLLVVQSFWQKAKDKVPYLLDPGQLPAAEVSLGDGLIAAQILFVLQLLMSAISPEGAIFRSTFLPGVTTFILILVYFKWMKIRNVPKFVPKEKDRAVLLALGGGIVGLGIAWVYLGIASHFPWLAGKMDESLSPLWKSDFRGLMVYAVCGAPVIEELIFRGLIYRGLKRSYPKWVALVLSALIFSVFHPGVAFPAVFVLGVILALIFDETEALFAPILAHTVYNLGILLLFP